MTLEVRYYGGGYELYENVLEILNVPDTMNIVIKCGFPHWETVALIRNDVKKMEVLV
jgi:hypothetical protein